MLKHINIRVKLFMLVFMILIPLILLSYIGIRDEYNNKIESELISYQDLAEAISMSFNNYLGEIWIQEDIIGTYFTEHPNLSNEEIQTYLKNVQSKEKTLLRLSLLNPIGIVIGSSEPSMIGRSYSEREYVTKVLNGEDKVLSNMVESKMIPGESVIPVVTAVKKEGKLVGIVSAIIDVNKLAIKLPKLRISQNCRFFLVDNNGKIVYRNDSSLPPIGHNYSIGPRIEHTFKGGTIKSLSQFISSVDGVKWISIDYPIKGIEWVCTVTSPYDKVMSQYYKEMYVNIIILILVSLASITTAIYLGNRILYPITKLKVFARKVTEGDYTARTYITGHDELGTVAKVLDSMVESVEQYDKFKSQFFTNISHELKTPLNVIFASVQLMANIQDSIDYSSYRSKINKQLKIIKQNCYRFTRIISNLIDISRHDSRYLKLRPGNYNIVGMIKEITMSVVKYAEVKGISIQFDTDVEEKVISFDPDMVERIILNLISNAIKFTETNGNIYVNVFDKQQSVVISVKDTGIGIPKDKLDMIFERFRQVDDSLSRNHEGSGIGLSLVKALVEAHGGTIQVSSELGKGSEFIVELPAKVLPEIESDNKKIETISTQNFVSRVNIEFSDIYPIDERY